MRVSNAAHMAMIRRLRKRGQIRAGREATRRAPPVSPTDLRRLYLTAHPRAA